MTDGRKNILVIEDSPELQELTKELLESRGYGIYCAGNGMEALDFLRHTMVKVDLILLDLMMPVMDGYEFRKLQLLDARMSGIPVVVTTAGGDAEGKAKKLGAQGFYNKAGNIDHLFQIIKLNLVDAGQ